MQDNVTLALFSLRLHQWQQEELGTRQLNKAGFIPQKRAVTDRRLSDVCDSFSLTGDLKTHLICMF